jgi:hypothetical protein
MLSATFLRAARNGDYVIVTGAQYRFTVVLMQGTEAATPLAGVIPLDRNFVARADAARHLWEATQEGDRADSSVNLTPAQPSRLAQLDGHLATESYQTTANALFSAGRVPRRPFWKTRHRRGRVHSIDTHGHKPHARRISRFTALRFAEDADNGWFRIRFAAVS